MKKYLIPKNGKYYKANLHCHSTISDGNLTPQELKDLYKAYGYSIIAYTDHDVLLSHSELNDEDFLALNGYEMELPTVMCEKTCHICLIALDPDNLTQVCYHRQKYMIGNGNDYRDFIIYDNTLPDFEREYCPEKVNEMIKIGRESGFFVTYNHPGWSLEGPDSYMNYHGMHAMEIYNHGCFLEGYPDYNEKEYEHMLRGGKKIYCIATDDNHNRNPIDSRKFDSLGGFTMIKSKDLSYKSITNALVNGDFYASNGPIINELWIEKDRVHITCSNADKIVLNTIKRPSKCVYATDGEPLTEAEFKIDKNSVYFRLSVYDEKGNHANTNAYFIDDLFKKRR